MFQAFKVKCNLNQINTLKPHINCFLNIQEYSFFATPSANTVQGVTPKFETISKASPNPNNVNPRIRKKNVFGLGFMLKGLSELHLTFGM